MRSSVLASSLAAPSKRQGKQYFAQIEKDKNMEKTSKTNIHIITRVTDSAIDKHCFKDPCDYGGN